MDVEKPYQVLLQALWEGAADAMALSDHAGIVQMANPAYYRLYGYNPEEVIGQSFAIIFPQEMQEWAIAQYQAVFHTYTPIPAYETTIRRKDGTERVVEARTMFITRDGVHTAMLSIVRDITEQRQYDVEWQRLAAVVEQAPDFIALSTAYGHRMYLNRAGLELLGMTGLYVSRHASILDYFSRDDRAVIQRDVLPAVMNEGRWAGEVLLLHSTSGAGIPVWLEAFRINDGQASHLVHIAFIAHASREQQHAE
jgi:PAS domain S-box-containing protein